MPSQMSFDKDYPLVTQFFLLGIFYKDSLGQEGENMYQIITDSFLFYSQNFYSSFIQFCEASAAHWDFQPAGIEPKTIPCPCLPKDWITGERATLPSTF